MDPKHFESLYPPDARFNELEKLISHIKSGNSSQLVSLPGVGRSNIMGLLAYNRAARTLHLKTDENKFHFVIANFSEIRNRPLSDATKFLFLTLAESLRERGMDEEYKKVNSTIQERIGSNDELVIFHGLRNAIDYLSNEKGLTVVFMFDRFDEYLPMLNQQFFSNLRSLRDKAKYKFSAVLSLNRPIEEQVEEGMLSDFYEFIVGNVVYLPIKDEKILNFRLNFLEKASGNKLSATIRESIIQITGGNGKLARICAEAYFSDKPSDDLSKFLLSQNRVIAVLNEIWKALTPYERRLIKTGQAFESSSLIAIGLVKNNEISLPLLEDFSKTIPSDDEKITLDPNTNEIKKGNVILSEGLTLSELKLLKYFLQNDGKTIERDNLISAVWGELSSTAGVSEQALDQLVFRLRKKIEENPNSPTHIKTVKGRGFVFST